MRNNFVFGLAAFLVLAGGLRAPAQEAADVVAQHRETYFTEVRKLDAKFSEQRKELDKKLATAVKALEERFAGEGNLEGVLAARETLEAIEDPFSDVVLPKRKNTDALKRAIEQHFQSARTLDTEETQARDELKTKYITYLERVKQRLTTERKIDEALAVHNEIERLNNEQKKAEQLAAPAKPAQPDKTLPVRPDIIKNPQQPLQPLPPNPDARKFTSDAEVVEKLKTLSGTTVSINGRIKAVENDNMTRGAFFITFESGVKLRLALPENTEMGKRGGVGILKGKGNYGEDILAPGAHIAVQTEIAKGTIHHTVPNTFLNCLVIGSDSTAARRRFRADCGGPCPRLTQRYASMQICGTYGNERTATLIYYY